MSNLFANGQAVEPDEPQIAIEPDAEPEIELEIEPEIEALSPPSFEPRAVVDVALVPMPLMEILPADFPLPALAKFCPDQRLKVAIDQAAAYVLSIDVTGAEGLQRADLALATVRTSVKAIEGHFEQPVAIANDLHKRLTGKRSEWIADGKAAIDTVGRRVWTEQRRLDAIAADERRKAQEDANRKAREEAEREAAAAKANQAPPQVVEELEKRAETAVAPPVAAPIAAPAMKNTTTVTTWKARIKGTPAEADPNPKMAEITGAQRLQVLALMQGVIDGRDPITAFELNWSVLNGRAKADKSTLSITGIEAFQEGGVRAKGTRSR